MSHPISSSHPLRQLFRALVQRTFQLSLGDQDPEVSGYLADLLTDFIHIDRIFRLRNARGRPIEEVAEMLMEGDVRFRATSFTREREVHKQIGDFILFWVGVYPEMLGTFQAPTRKDHLIDYVDQGKSSYYIASTFDYGIYRNEARVLRRMSSEFETCLFALNRVRQEMDRMGHPDIQAVHRSFQE